MVRTRPPALVALVTLMSACATDAAPRGTNREESLAPVARQESRPAPTTQSRPAEVQAMTARVMAVDNALRLATLSCQEAVQRGDAFAIFHAGEYAGLVVITDVQDLVAHGKVTGRMAIREGDFATPWLIEARVASVDRTRGVATLSCAGKIPPQPGNQFAVFSGHQYACTLVVTDVTGQTASGRIKDSRLPFMENDRASTRVPQR